MKTIYNMDFLRNFENMMRYLGLMITDLKGRETTRTYLFDKGESIQQIEYKTFEYPIVGEIMEVTLN